MAYNNKEVAELLFKLARGKGNWGAKGDRLEHFKRFFNLKEIIKDYSKKGWILIKGKPTFILISLNPHHKREIIEFIENELRDYKGYIK